MLIGILAFNIGAVFFIGFTLIELMIVVAIIGILAAVALPAYQDYTARAQVSEAFTMTSGIKATIAEYGQTNGSYPGEATNPDVSSLTVTGKYGAAEVAKDSGVITITMGDAGSVASVIAGKKITLTPSSLTNNSNAFTFECESPKTDGVALKYLPKICKAES